MADLRADSSVTRWTPAQFAYPAALVILALITWSLWLPFGWHVPGTFEEWGIMTGVDQLGPRRFLYIASSHRPLYMAPWAIAEWLTPGSFFALNVLQALFIGGKAVAMFVLLRRLVPEDPGVALLGACLLLVYPADDAVLTLRTTNLHAGSFFLLVSACLLVAAQDRFRWPTLVAMMALQSVSLATYDGGLLVMIGLPLLVAWRSESPYRRKIRLTIIWWIVPSVFFFQLIRAMRNPTSYQTLLIELSGVEGDTFDKILVWGKSLARAVIRIFGTGWKDAVTRLSGPGDYFVQLAMAITILVVLPAIWIAFRQVRQSDSPIRRKYLLLCAIGVILAVAGFAMYLPTTWRNTNWRVFIYSSIGASIAVAVAIRLVASLFRASQKIAFVALGGLLFWVGLVNAFDQHDYYYMYGQRQQAVIAGIVETARTLSRPIDVLLLDTTPTAVFDAWIMCTVVSDCLTAQLRYAYPGIEIDAAYCAPGWRARGEFSETCAFGPNGVTISYKHLESKQPMQKMFPYESLLVFENSPAGITLLSNIDAYAGSEAAGRYQPLAHIDGDSDVPPRAHTMFTRWPFRARDPRARQSSSYQFEFDRQPPGYGWSNPEGSLTWTNAPESTLDFWLAPGSDYDLRFRVVRGITQDVLSSLRVTVNGVPVAVAATGDKDGGTIFAGTIASAAVSLDPERTQVAFHVDRVVTPKSLRMNDDERTLGLRFDWIRISQVK